ncbi:hypothetical protein ABW19_dt0207151 [Dactylella cylindrospora]|nr:hypothetical protein ABW19_dt0207151 [Dactylella cylindrospora]
MAFASASRKFGNDSDSITSSAPSNSTSEKPHFSHFSSHHDDDGRSTSSPRIDRFAFNRFGMQKDSGRSDRNDRNDRNDRGFGDRRGNDDRRDRDRDGNDRGNRRFGERGGANNKDDEGGGWNTVTRPRKSFGHNDDGEKFRREHGKSGDRDRDREVKDRPNRYEPFSKDRGDRDREGDRDRRDGSGWKDRDHNKRREGKGRDEASWFLTDEERAARNAIREKEFREQREQRAAEREMRNGRYDRDRDRDRDRDHRDKERDLDRETFGDSRTFGRGFEKTEKEPEWMDAMPGNDGKEFKVQSTEDFQRWKAAMKARSQQSNQPAESEKSTAKESKDEEIVFKPRKEAEKRAIAVEETQPEPVEEPPTPSVAENGVDKFWGWNTSSTSLASKGTDTSAKQSAGEKTPVIERSSRFRNFFHAQDQQIPSEAPVPLPAPVVVPVSVQLTGQEQLAQLQAQHAQQVQRQQEALSKQQNPGPPVTLLASSIALQQFQGHGVIQGQQPSQPMNQPLPQPQQQSKDRPIEATKEDREGFNNILQMLGRARLSSPPNPETRDTFLNILGAPSQQGTPVSHSHPTPPANHPANNIQGPPPPQQLPGLNRQQQQGPPPIQTSHTGKDSILTLLRHSDMPTPQGPPPPPPFLTDYQNPNGPPVSHSPPVHQRGGKNSVPASALSDPAIRAIGRPQNEGPPGLPKNMYNEHPHQHVRSPSQILEAHQRGFPGMDIRPPPGMEQRNTPLEHQQKMIQEQAQRGMDPRHLDLIRSEHQRRMIEAQMRMGLPAGGPDLPHGNFPPNPPPRMEQRGPPGPPPLPNTDQGPPMGMPGMGENGPMPGNWGPPPQHPQSQSSPPVNTNQQRPPPGFFGRPGPGGPGGPGPANGGNVSGPGAGAPGGPGGPGPMPPLPFYGPGPGLGNMPPLPFGQHGMPPPPNLANMPNFPPFHPAGPGGPGGPMPPQMPPQGFPPFPFHEGMMGPFGGPDGLRSPQHQHPGGAGGPPGMFTGR